MADDAVVTDDRRRRLSGVDDRAVLDRRPGTDPDFAVVAAQHRVRPDARVGTDRHVADDARLRVHERVRMNLRLDVTERIDRHAATPTG